jgi:hypothetical protein
MRFIDVVLGCVLLGLVVSFLQMERPNAANAGGAEPRTGERLTWLWTPAMRRTSAVQ